MAEQVVLRGAFLTAVVAGSYLAYNSFVDSFFKSKIAGRIRIVGPDQINYIVKVLTDLYNEFKAGMLTKYQYDVKRAELFINYGDPAKELYRRDYIPTPASITNIVVDPYLIVALRERLQGSYDKLIGKQISQKVYDEELAGTLDQYGSLSTQKYVDFGYTPGNTYEAFINNETAAQYYKDKGFNIDELLAGTWTVDGLRNAKLISEDEYRRRKYPQDYRYDSSTGSYQFDPYNKSTGSQMSGAEAFRSGTDPELSGGASGSIPGGVSVPIGTAYATSYKQEFNIDGSVYGYWYAGQFYNPQNQIVEYSVNPNAAGVYTEVPQGQRPPPGISASTAAYLDAKAKAKLSTG